MKHRIRTQPTEEQLEQLGQLADRMDNLRAGLSLQWPPKFHVDQMKPILKEMSTELKSIVIGLSGANPWEGNSE